jgi:hypothetical protein
MPKHDQATAPWDAWRHAEEEIVRLRAELAQRRELQAMMAERILPAKLQDMRQWASEQGPDVRERVLLLCDALEDCGNAAYDAQAAMRLAQSALAELRADTERLAFALGIETRSGGRS